MKKSPLYFLRVLLVGITILSISLAMGCSCRPAKTTTTIAPTTLTTTTTTTIPTTTTTTATTTRPPVTTTPTITRPSTTTIKPSGLPSQSQDITFDLEARNSDFSIHNLVVASGASVTIRFHNEDIGITHNFAIYTTPNSLVIIFRGAAITGPSTISYSFTAPATSGTYYYRCDTHPTTMVGSLIVQ
jgi:plastocyanin